MINNNRLIREKEAHEVRDVLDKNKQIKIKYFKHTTSNKFYLNFTSLLLEKINPVEKKNILELGSGLGDRSISFAKSGGIVTGIDISKPYVDMSNIKAKEFGLGNDFCVFIVMDCHVLDFSENSFDIVCGDAILHHLELESVLKEIHRVLKPGGVAVFIEPLAANPFLKIFRILTPGARTIDERPLNSNNLKTINKNWIVYSEYYGIICAPVAALTSIIGIKNPNNIFIVIAAKIEKLLNKYSIFWPANQYVLLHLKKP